VNPPHSKPIRQESSRMEVLETRRSSVWPEINPKPPNPPNKPTGTTTKHQTPSLPLSILVQGVLKARESVRVALGSAHLDGRGKTPVKVRGCWSLREKTVPSQSSPKRRGKDDRQRSEEKTWSRIVNRYLQTVTDLLAEVSQKSHRAGAKGAKFKKMPSGGIELQDQCGPSRQANNRIDVRDCKKGLKSASPRETGGSHPHDLPPQSNN